MTNLGMDQLSRRVWAGMRSLSFLPPQLRRSTRSPLWVPWRIRDVGCLAFKQIIPDLTVLGLTTSLKSLTASVRGTFPPSGKGKEWLFSDPLAGLSDNYQEIAQRISRGDILPSGQPDLWFSIFLVPASVQTSRAKTERKVNMNQKFSSEWAGWPSRGILVEHESSDFGARPCGVTLRCGCLLTVTSQSSPQWNQSTFLREWLCGFKTLGRIPET